MEYVAAEYFIEALGKSQTFSVSYDFVLRLIDQAPQDVVSYLKKEIQNGTDFLFIFKKFSDVFIVNGQTITLTDAFLSLYAFPDSSNFSISHEYSSVFEVDVIEYFKLILCRCISCHYNLLFNALLSQNSSQLASFFSHYTLRDKYLFFQKHSNTFAVVNDNIYLKLKASTKNTETIVKDSDYSKLLKKLTKSTYFLLSCFESLHYIEVKQCICFVLSNVKEFLNQHSLIKQREIFENMPDITMDGLGYLSLQHLSVESVKSRTVRLIILIVCILAFEREMHIEKIVKEVQKRCSAEISSSLCELSKSEQYDFFVSYSEYFIVQNNGYINLLSSFIFPLCSFESTSPNLQTAQNTHKNISNYVSNAQNIQFVNLHPNPVVTSQNFYINFSNTMQKPQQQFLDYGCNTQQQFLHHGSNTGPNVINVRVELSIIYLKTIFDSPDCQNILKSLLHILDDVRVRFFSLSQTDQDNFIKDCYNIFSSIKSVESASDLLSLSYVNNNEKTLMCITYSLLKESRMHFQKISSMIISKNINSLFLLLDISGQFFYFKRMERYFTVEINGYITLNQPFLLINSIIDTRFHMLSSIQGSLGNTNPSNKKSENSTKDSLSESSKNKADNSAVDLNVTDMKEEMDMPLTICNKLHFSVLFLQNCFHPLIAKHILETFLHALNSVKLYFSGLTTKDQHRFIAKYFQFINCEDVLEVSPLSSNSNTETLIQDEECLLFITYLLIIKKTSLHYRNIVKEMKKYLVMPQLLTTSDSNCFKYFQNFSEYFVITGEGFVCLSSAFSSLSSIISSVSAFSQEIQKKMNKHIKSQSEFLSNCEIKNQDIVNKCQKIVISIDSTKEKTERNVSLKEETAVGGELNMKSHSASNIIIDICISILSVSEKMQIEKLCNHLNAIGITSIRNYFSFHTVAEKLHFFLNLSQYFDVTRDGFVSIREHVLQSYVPKTNYIKQDSNGRFVSCNPTVSKLSNKLESIKKCDSSDLSDSSSNMSSTSVGLKKTRGKRVHKRNRIMKKQITVDPLAISRVNNFLCSGNNVNKNSNNKSISSMNKKFKALTLSSQSQNIKEENRETDSFGNSAKVEQVSHKDYVKPVISDSVDPWHSSKFNIPSNSNIEIEKNMNSSHSSPRKYIFKNIWKTEPIDSNNDLLENDTKLTNPAIRSNENFPRSDVPQNDCLKKRDILHNEDSTNDCVQRNGTFIKNGEPRNGNLTKCDNLHTEEILTNNNVQYRDNYIKCSVNYNENVLKNENVIKSASPTSLQKSSMNFDDSNVPKNCLINDLEYDSYKSYGTELLSSFLGELDTDNNISKMQNSDDTQSSHKVAHKQLNSENMEKMPIKDSKNYAISKISNPQNLGNSKHEDLMPNLHNSSSYLTGDIIEFRAVNFFCVILGKYDIGLSADFLMQHINLASLEVQRFMYCHCKENALSLFVNHKKDFYVSPQTNSVYLVKKP